MERKHGSEGSRDRGSGYGMTPMRLRRIELSFGGGVALALAYVAILAGFVIGGSPAQGLRYLNAIVFSVETPFA